MAAKEREKLARWKTVNFYEVLGLAPSATQSEVKKGFKRVALSCHPDKVPEAEREEATKRFQLIAEAYEVLANETTRRQYDNVRPRSGGGAAWQPQQVPRGTSRQQPAPTPQAPRQQKQQPQPQPQASGARFGFNGFNAGPRCEGCDRRCPVTEIRNCSECERRGLISGICPRCTMCAACAPEDMFGSDTEDKGKKARPSGAAAASAPPAATPKRVWKNAPTRKIPSDEGPPTPPRPRPGWEPPMPRKASPKFNAPYPPAYQPAAASSAAPRPAQPAAAPANSRGVPSSAAAAAAHAKSPSAPAGVPDPARGVPAGGPDVGDGGRGPVGGGTVEERLMWMGYSQEDAHGAASRCSSVEAALEFLESGPRKSVEAVGGIDGAYLGAKAPPGQKGPVERIVGGERVVSLCADGDEEDEPALDMFGILRALGFSEDDVRAAVDRCSTVEAAVEYIMKFHAEGGAAPRAKPPPPARLLPALDGMAAGAFAAAAAVGSYAAAMVGGTGGAQTVEEAPPPANPQSAQLIKSLVDLGFPEKEASEAARRCSSVEAAVEWIAAQQPVASI